MPRTPVAVVLAVVLAVFHVPSAPAEPLPSLSLLVPVNPGGGWD